MEKQADPELFQVQANFLQGVQCTKMKRTIFALITQAINKLIRWPYVKLILRLVHFDIYLLKNTIDNQ